MGKIEVSRHHICVACGRQFIDDYAARQNYSDDVESYMFKNVALHNSKMN